MASKKIKKQNAEVEAAVENTEVVTGEPTEETEVKEEKNDETVEVEVINPNEAPIETTESEASTDDEEKAADEEPTDDSGVTADPSLVDESEASTEKKRVRVRLRDKYHCNVGGKFFYFEKGQCYNVPENVKRVLAKADMLVIV